MLQRVVEMAATALDDAEVRFGERGMDAIAGSGCGFREVGRKRLAARVVAFRERDLDALRERVREIGHVVAAFGELRDALPFAVRSRERADRGEQVSGEPGGGGVGRGAADAAEQGGRDRHFEEIGDRACAAHRGGGRGAARPGFCARGRVRRVRFADHRRRARARRRTMRAERAGIAELLVPLPDPPTAAEPNPCRSQRAYFARFRVFAQRALADPALRRAAS